MTNRDASHVVPKKWKDHYVTIPPQDPATRSWQPAGDEWQPDQEGGQYLWDAVSRRWVKTRFPTYPEQCNSHHPDARVPLDLDAGASG